MSFAGRTALVTGGARGIGAAVCARLAADGAAVVVADVDGGAARAHADAIGATAVAFDVADPDAARAAIEAVGTLDVLVCNAGVDQHAFFTELPPADWRRLIAVNLEGVLSCAHAALPAMQRAGYGRIVVVASEAGRLGSKGGAVYAAAKGGAIAFTRSIARENARFGITANAVAPGPIETPLLERAVAAGGDRLAQAMRDATLAGRLGHPDEVAAAVAFLASEEAGYVTGEVLGVSGGMGTGA